MVLVVPAGAARRRVGRRCRGRRRVHPVASPCEPGWRRCPRGGHRGGARRRPAARPARAVAGRPRRRGWPAPTGPFPAAPVTDTVKAGRPRWSSGHARPVPPGGRADASGLPGRDTAPGPPGGGRRLRRRRPGGSGRRPGRAGRRPRRQPQGDLARSIWWSSAALAAVVAAVTPRVGLGFDIHPFSDDPGRPLSWAASPSPGRGLAGHSDADAVAHAICDALLGAAGLGDIGTHFPDDDPAYAGVDSTEPAGPGGASRVRRLGDRQRRRDRRDRGPQAGPLPAGHGAAADSRSSARR